MEFIVKYLFIIILTHLGVKFYKWANRKCSGINAGIIAAVATLAMDFSGGLITGIGGRDVVAFVSEALIVFGVVVGVHVLRELLLYTSELVRSRGRISPCTYKNLPQREEAFVVAVDGLADVFCSASEGAVLSAANPDLSGPVGLAWQRKLQENRAIVSSQLNAMAELMKSWLTQDECLDKRNRIKLARIAFEAREQGIEAKDIHIYKTENGHLVVNARVYGRWGGGIPMKRYVSAVEKALEMKFRLYKDARSIVPMEETEVTLYEQNKFYVLPGIAAKKMSGSPVSGDNYLMFERDCGKYHLCLSDGMGSGAVAAKESELVVELLEKFIEAGFKRETAVKMLNSAMVLSGEAERFSTLDYCEIDLYTGVVSMIKIGASASFLVRDGDVTVINWGSLPAGVDVDQKFESTDITLASGDFLVMVTDGVLEYLQVKEPIKKFTEILQTVDTENAGAYASDILDKVLVYNGGCARDDMTVIVLGIWEK